MFRPANVQKQILHGLQILMELWYTVLQLRFVYLGFNTLFFFLHSRMIIHQKREAEDLRVLTLKNHEVGDFKLLYKLLFYCQFTTMESD